MCHGRQLPGVSSSWQGVNSVVCDFDAVNQRLLCCWPSQMPSGSMCGSICTLEWKLSSCHTITWQRFLKALGPRPACTSCSSSTREPVLLLPVADQVVFCFMCLLHLLEIVVVLLHISGILGTQKDSNSNCMHGASCPMPVSAVSWGRDIGGTGSHAQLNIQ